MRRATILLPTLALVTACGGGSKNVDAENASVAEVSAKMHTMQRQQPGKWETTTRITAMDNPDIPKGSPVDKLMLEQMGKEQVTNACITAQQAERPVFAQAVNPTHKCRYDHVSLRGGHIDALLECPAPDAPGTVEMRHVGSYTPTSFDVEATMTRKDADGGNAGSMTMRITAKRVGDCKA